ncbi:DUF3099 domain-containing protein [Streptomyces sp. NBC_00237]|uniref:DUF3099 domain-containing protein n=1 Tax=Streptomyces sp. NBC_00237 TaxID=2975687 RepID=UPI0022554ABA|nr:DUF3099 domain-containing protein [Streptomyces sp. NBC_00237]MCX5200345.1 DUF3099 domain-containing protein [Streptomyces sp. NBC_00237]
MYARRRRGYFLMMGTCLVLFVTACAFVRLWSVPVAVAMCVVAAAIPPFAAMVANRKGPGDREGVPPAQAKPRAWGRDETTGDRRSDDWWDELDGRHKRE